ncbi:MAG TPA: histidine phosphatase family protein [Bacteroidia bacterium]|nr:histidine phosphatase family protein [Bacteroidia bacterium]
MKTVVLARHAKSDWATGLPDHDRPLNSRGKSDAPRMGRALSDLQFTPDLMVSSSALRARATAEAVAREIHFYHPIRIEPKIYEEGHGQIMSLLQALPDDVNNVMVFGHNPTLEQLASYMLQMHAAVAIPTSGMLCMESNVHKWASLQPGEAILKWFLIPKLLS